MSRNRTQPLEPDDRALSKRIEEVFPLELPANLRRRQSPPEGVPWSVLRGRKLGGFRFRRQEPIGRFVVDVFCDEAALVVEIDGSVHASRRAEDRSRDAWLGKQGLRVLGFGASELSKNKDGVLEEILRIARSRSKTEGKKKKQ